MRTIKFRAWDGNKMYKPSGLPGFLEEHFDFKEGTFLKIENKKGVLMQFTGLLDKNGKEIFEGDILLWQSSEIDPVSKEFVFEKVMTNTEFLLGDGS